MTPSPRLRPLLLLLSLALAAATASSCRKGRQPITDPQDHTPEAVALPRVTSKNVMLFPPPSTAHDRPAQLRAPAAEFTAELPPPGDDGRIAVARSFTVTFSHPVDLEAATNAPARLTPPVRNEQTWLSPRQLQIVAPDGWKDRQTYQLIIPRLRSQAGQRMAAQTEASFYTPPDIEIGGKHIAYHPEPGKPRPIAVLTDGPVRPHGRYAILFDQPVGLVTAKSLVTLIGRHDALIALRFGHPTKRRFGGVNIDPRFVVIAQPMKPLSRGLRYTIRAVDKSGKNERTGNIEVIEKPSTKSVTCGWGSHRVCRVSQHAITTNQRELSVRFSHAIATKGPALRKAVRVFPPVRNLKIDNESGYWDWGSLRIRGDFRPGRTYRVHVSGLYDRFGQSVPPIFDVSVDILPQDSSATIAEGVLTLDQAQAKSFVVASRNTKTATLDAWEVKRSELPSALAELRRRSLPDAPPDQSITVPIASKVDERVVTTVNLSRSLKPDVSYIVASRVTETAHGASAAAFRKSQAASQRSSALVTIASGAVLDVHARRYSDNSTLVQVMDRISGAPIAKATVARLGSPVASATTDADGVALVPGGNVGDVAIAVSHGDAHALLTFDRDTINASAIFPRIAENISQPKAIVATSQTDRGIYRPGETVHARAVFFKRSAGKEKALARVPIRFVATDSRGKRIHEQPVVTTKHGSAIVNFVLPRKTALGPLKLAFTRGSENAPQAVESVEVAEFVAPRFKVDIMAAGSAVRAGGKRHLRATIAGKYLFGSPLKNGSVSWTVRRSDATVPAGPLSKQGLVFGRTGLWHDGHEGGGEQWEMSGQGKLNARGELVIDQAVAMPTKWTRPVRFAIQAAVTDASAREANGHTAFMSHPAKRYAGVRGPGSWVDVGSKALVSLGVADRLGKPISGANTTARLYHASFRAVRTRTKSGALETNWRETRTEIGSCSVATTHDPVTCEIEITKSGELILTAEVDGRAGGEVRFWGYGGSPSTHAMRESTDVQLLTNKASYQAGDTAEVMVMNPFGKARGLITLESDGLLSHQTHNLKPGANLVSIPIEQRHAPFVHVVASVVPLDGSPAERARYRMGAKRLQVSADAHHLDVVVGSNKTMYRPAEAAEIAVQVRKGQSRVANVAVAIAVVDEAVLRLTNFHFNHPAKSLHIGVPLAFELSDTRNALRDLLQKSHSAGDGDGGEESSPSRQNFAKTAFFAGEVVTDDDGRAKVAFTLPDNLTEFRIMAVAVDQSGRGGTGSSAITVTKPRLIEPVLPRFATVGDRFTVQANVHNRAPVPFRGKVSFNGKTKSVKVRPASTASVHFDVAPGRAGALPIRFVLENSHERVEDSVKKTLPIRARGVTQHPKIVGNFRRQQKVRLAIPKGASGEALTIRVGRNLRPELGARLGFLLGYPHGCVEQTTSSTLPLLASRKILPRIGVEMMTESELVSRIKVGLRRLATMQTREGGLAYWPGGSTANVYGTAYAMRALVAAKAAKIAIPTGLLSGMTKYLSAHFANETTPLEVRAAIAQSLAEIGKPAFFDSDFINSVHGTSVFGVASLALALKDVPGQSGPRERLLDDLETAFDSNGSLSRTAHADDFYYYGSEERTRAQAAMALTTLRPESRLVAQLLGKMNVGKRHYTTQAAAYELLALARNLEASDDQGDEVTLLLGNEPVAAHRTPAPGIFEFQIPVERLAGKSKLLRIASSAKVSGFSVEARFRAPTGAATGSKGPNVYRLLTTVDGSPLDPAAIKFGDVVRVTVGIGSPSHVVGADRRYLAIVDSLPGGFEPVRQQRGRPAPTFGNLHPWANIDRRSPTYSEQRDDRMQIYDDRGVDEQGTYTYLVRATTRGTFSHPPTQAEMMYTADSQSFGEGGSVTIR